MTTADATLVRDPAALGQENEKKIREAVKGCKTRFEIHAKMQEVFENVIVVRAEKDGDKWHVIAYLPHEQQCDLVCDA